MSALLGSTAFSPSAFCFQLSAVCFPTRLTPARSDCTLRVVLVPTFSGSRRSVSETDTDSAGVLELAGIYALFAVVYVLTAARTFLGGDSGLFATIFADGGYAHPPGYPLYSAYLNAMEWLPANSPAHGASIATALIGAAAVAWFYAAARRWGAGTFGAAFGTIAFGLAAQVWLYHSQPEVFALNHLVAAALLWAAAPNARFRGGARIACLGLLAGLGLSNHHTIIFLAPVGFWGLYAGLRESDANSILLVLLGGVALAVGLSPYAYLWYVDQFTTGWHWGSAESLREIAYIFLRRDYGTFQMTAGETPVAPLEQIAFLAQSATLDLYGVPVLLAVYAAAKILVEGTDDEDRAGAAVSRAGIATLVGSLLLAGPLFVTLLTRHPEGLDAVLIRRFHLLPELLLAFLAALGAGLLRSVVPQRSLQAVVIAAMVAAAGLGITATSAVHRAPTVEQYVEDTFSHVENDAVVVGTGDHRFFGALYLQRALDRRPDLDYVDAKLLVYRWYHRRTIERLDISFPYAGESIDTTQLFSEILDRGRPLYVTHPFHDGIFEGRRTAPLGTLIRVDPPSDFSVDPVSLFRKNQTLYEQFDIETRPNIPSASWAHFVLEEYASTWETLADALLRAQRPDLARRADRLAQRFSPNPPPHDD